MDKLNKNNFHRRNTTERIIQFGEGNFMRAFADWIVAKMNAKVGFDSSVVIVKPRKNGSLESFREQDCLYQVNIQGLDTEGHPVDTIEVVDSVSRCLNAYEDYEEFISLASQPEIRFVFSNTTEAGITYDPSCRLDDKPAASYPAKLTQLLFHRYKTFKGDLSKGLIIMPCELIFHNGKQLKECIDKHIEDWQEQLGDDYKGFKEWFNKSNYICNTLVDRIVTGHPKQGIENIQKRTGFDDSLLVQCEYYHFWAIEPPSHLGCNKLSKEFPVKEAGLNVLITDNESPYHERKVKLLNAPHTVLSPVAFLSGNDIVRDACQDPLVGAFIKKVMQEELIPTIDMDSTELQHFASDVLKRFLNPYIDHQLTSIMLNSFSKFAARDLPSLLAYQKKNGCLPKGLVLGLASIIVYYKGGQRNDGLEIHPNDTPEVLNLIEELWRSYRAPEVVNRVLKAKEILWKEHGDLSQIPGLQEMLTYYVISIMENGMDSTIKSVL